MKTAKILLSVQLQENRHKSKFFFLYLNGLIGPLDDLNEIDDYICYNLSLENIVDDYGPIHDWSIYTAEFVDTIHSTNSIEIGIDPKILKKEERQKLIVKKFEENLDNYSVERKHIKVDFNKGLFKIKNKAFGKLEISIDSIYNLIEKDTVDNIVLTNSFKEEILYLRHGSFLNAGLADIKVFNNVEEKEKYSYTNNTAKGGIYIRDDGELHIGDMNRTKFLVVNMTALVKELYVKGMIGKGTKYLNNLNF